MVSLIYLTHINCTIIMIHALGACTGAGDTVMHMGSVERQPGLSYLCLRGVCLGVVS